MKPYINKQTIFSNSVHDELIRIKFYEKLFESNNLEIIDTTVTKDGYTKEAQMLDQKYGVDYRIIINNNKSNEISFTIQERFRNIKYKKYQDFTIRQQTKTGLKSELSKINADFMIYGYVDENNKIDQIIVANIPIIKMALSHKNLKYSTRINYDQSKFITILFDDLFKIGAITNLKHL